MRRHGRYITTYLGARALFVVAILTILASIITWMEGVKSVYAGEEADALLYVWLKLPSYLALSLPPGFLLGITLGLHQLAKRHELVAFSAQGLSPWQVVWVPALALGLVFGALHAYLLHQAVPSTRHQSDALASKLGMLDPVSQIFSVRRHWIKTDEAFVFVERVAPGRRLENVIWVEKKKGEAPSLIAMAHEASLLPVTPKPKVVSLEMPQAKILDLKATTPKDLAVSPCAASLQSFLDGEKVAVDFDACPLSPLPQENMPQTQVQHFTREIPESLSFLLRLTGHPDGFFTEELQYLLTSARAYGYSLEAYSASIRSRFLWPLLTLLLALAAAFLGARAKPSTGIYFPFAVMLITYLTGFGLVHLATQL